MSVNLSSFNPTMIRQTPFTLPKSVNLTLKTVVVECSNHSSNKIVPDRRCSCCTRRRFFGSLVGSGLLPVFPSSSASGEDSRPQIKVREVFNGIRPPRPDWYEELYALALDKLMKPYEAEIAGYKSRLFANLKGKPENILEIGVGTGPNLKYYADYPGVNVFGVDPNRKMEKYAQAAAEETGIKPSNFMFMQGVEEALPLDDASVDAVVGTLVLCSVNDVDRALQEIMRVLKPGGIYIFVEHVAAKDGTLLRFVQRILDPLQQTVADGCHLTRNTADNIVKTGFSSLDMNQVSVSTASIINPHLYGVAYK